MRSKRQVVIHLAPQDLAAAVRDVLAGTAVGVANITIKLLGAVTPSPEHAAGPAPRRAASSSPAAREPWPLQDDTADAKAEPGFAFARLRGWSLHASSPTASVLIRGVTLRGQVAVRWSAIGMVLAAVAGGAE